MSRMGDLNLARSELVRDAFWIAYWLLNKSEDADTEALVKRGRLLLNRAASAALPHEVPEWAKEEIDGFVAPTTEPPYLDRH